MNTSMIIDTLSRKQNGSFFKIRLVSDVKLNAEAKRNGVVAFLSVERMGIHIIAFCDIGCRGTV